MVCFGYSASEKDEIGNEDFTTYFMCSLGEMPIVIDVLTIVHHAISFDEAEKHLITHNINVAIELILSVD